MPRTGHTRGGAQRAASDASAEAVRRIQAQARCRRSLMVPGDGFLPGLRPNDDAVAQQSARVLVEERLRIARYVEAPAPGEYVILYGLDVLGLSQHARRVRMGIFDVISEP